MFKNHQENENFADTTFVYGKLFCQELFRGCYVLLRFPIKRLKHIVNSNTFKDEEKLCRPVFLVRLDKVRFKKWALSWKFIWRPIKD